MNSNVSCHNMFCDIPRSGRKLLSVICVRLLFVVYLFIGSFSCCCLLKFYGVFFIKLYGNFILISICLIVVER